MGTKPKLSIAQMSAMGTVAAPAPGTPPGTVPTPGGPPPGGAPPGGAPIDSGSSQPPPVMNFSGPPVGGPVPSRPVVGAHGEAPSIGTHASKSRHKRGDPTHGIGK